MHGDLIERVLQLRQIDTAYAEVDLRTQREIERILFNNRELQLLAIPLGVLSLVIVGVFTTIVTIVLIFVCRAVTQMRVDAETETNGLDLSVHGERAYDMTS